MILLFEASEVEQLMSGLEVWTDFRQYPQSTSTDAYSKAILYWWTSAIKARSPFMANFNSDMIFAMTQMHKPEKHKHYEFQTVSGQICRGQIKSCQSIVCRPTWWLAYYYIKSAFVLWFSEWLTGPIWTNLKSAPALYFTEIQRDDSWIHKYSQMMSNIWIQFMCE